MTTIKKLSAMPYAQAHVEIDDDGSVYLFSYTTLVAGITADGTCYCNGLYSMTTRKHISAFAREYASPLTYYSFKMMYEENITINMETGEVEERNARPSDFRQEVLKMLTVNIKCPICGNKHEVKVNPQGYYDWALGGALIQRALPELSPTEREQLISGLCPKCQRTIFGE